MYLIKDELDYFEEKFTKIIQIFLSKKVRSGSESGTNIPDPNLTWPKGYGSDGIRIYHTLTYNLAWWKLEQAYTYSVKLRCV